MDNENTVVYRQESVLATNKVLRNTYLLLSLTLIFSAVTAGIALKSNAAPLNIFVILIVYLGLPMAIQMTKKSTLGLVLVFVFTGIVGWTLGPILNLYIKEFTNGNQIIMMALGGTGLIFLVLSAIAMNPKRDFLSWGHFLSIGAIVAVVLMLLNIFLFKVPALQLAISVIFALVSGGYIMFQTNLIVKGGETSYISATIILYISMLNIFLTLLQILGLFAGNRR